MLFGYLWKLLKTLHQSWIPDIDRKSRLLSQLEGPHWNIAITFGKEKLELWIYQTVKKFENMFTYYDRINIHPDGQTNGQCTTA